MGLLTRWQEYARQYGTMGLVRHLVARAVRPVWETNAALLLTLEPPAPAVLAKIPLRIAEVRPEEVEKAGFAGPDWGARWAEGHRCFGAWVEDRLVHHSWVSTRDTVIAEIHSTLCLSNGEAYIYDCYTDGQQRGKRIFPAVLSHIGQQFSLQGYTRIWIAVEEENRSSLQAIQRAGFRVAAEVTYRRLGGKASKWIQQPPGAPKIHLN